MGEKKNSLKILICKSEEKRPLGTTKSVAGIVILKRIITKQRERKRMYVCVKGIQMSQYVAQVRFYKHVNELHLYLLVRKMFGVK